MYKWSSNGNGNGNGYLYKKKGTADDGNPGGVPHVNKED